MKLQIKDKEIELKYSMRSMMLYENIKNEAFNPKTLQDIVIFFYCVILASDKHLQFTFDELIDMLDENPMLLEQFSDWLTQSINTQNMLSDNTENDPKPDTSKK